MRLSTEKDIPEKVECEQKQHLVVQGQILTTLYDDPISSKDESIVAKRKIFEELVLQFKCAVFCRTTPNQKAYMVSHVRRAGYITMAIGDGANDVNMIQKAHLGIGIIGNEGRQAANSSDFAVAYFRDVKRYWER